MILPFDLNPSRLAWWIVAVLNLLAWSFGAVLFWKRHFELLDQDERGRGFLFVALISTGTALVHALDVIFVPLLDGQPATTGGIMVSTENAVSGLLDLALAVLVIAWGSFPKWSAWIENLIYSIYVSVRSTRGGQHGKF